MKKSRKAICSLILLMLMAMSLATRAFANSPSITFQGFSKGFDFRPGSEYTETDLFGNFKNLMPGDAVTETITFTNAATDCDFVNLYMRAEAHDETANPLSPKVAEGETLATMTEFLSQLSMKVWNGTELIYEASPHELDGLKSNKLLGVFRTGQSAALKVQLSVPLALDNRFANRVGLGSFVTELLLDGEAHGDVIALIHFPIADEPIHPGPKYKSLANGGGNDVEEGILVLRIHPLILFVHIGLQGGEIHIQVDEGLVVCPVRHDAGHDPVHRRDILQPDGIRPVSPFLLCLRHD